MAFFALINVSRGMQCHSVVNKHHRMIAIQNVNATCGITYSFHSKCCTVDY